MKKGSTVIESIVALAIILISITISFQISIVTFKSIDLRRNKEIANRLAYAIENEIKYNISITELDKIFKNGNLHFRYRDDVIDFLSKNSLLLLENGDNIIIEKIREESSEGIYKIYVYKVKILSTKGGALAEREFIKSYWMDM